MCPLRIGRQLCLWGCVQEVSSGHDTRMVWAAWGRVGRTCSVGRSVLGSHWTGRPQRKTQPWEWLMPTGHRVVASGRGSACRSFPPLPPTNEHCTSVKFLPSPGFNRRRSVLPCVQLCLSPSDHPYPPISHPAGPSPVPSHRDFDADKGGNCRKTETRPSPISPYDGPSMARHCVPLHLKRPMIKMARLETSRV